MTFQRKGLTTSLFAVGLALLASGAGCASETGSESTDGREEIRLTAQLEIETPKAGFQVQTKGAVIEAGDDVEWCEVVQLPGSPKTTYEIGWIESAMTPYAHYLLVSAAVMGSETETNIEAGTRINCQRAGEVYGKELTDLFTSQRHHETVRYPRGVGKILRGGQKIVIDYQYFNTSDEPILAKVKINFHLADNGAVEKVARLATLNNLTIYTPPHGESSHLGECFFERDVSISALARHTHQWGTTFKAWFAGGRRDGELIWSSASQEESSDVLLLSNPLLISAGEGIRFQCDYRNTTSEPLQFGAKVNDEVCLLEATLWASGQEEEEDKQSCLLFTVDEDGVARK